jgi:hypothetical protein
MILPCGHDSDQIAIPPGPWRKQDCAACWSFKYARVYRRHYATTPQAPASKPPGLGDAVEAALLKFRIKARVEKWLGPHCGCKERQEKLNRLGRWAKRVMPQTFSNNSARQS